MKNLEDILQQVIAAHKTLCIADISAERVRMLANTQQEALKDFFSLIQYILEALKNSECTEIGGLQIEPITEVINNYMKYSTDISEDSIQELSNLCSALSSVMRSGPHASILDIVTSIEES